ncbi:plasminogen activator inhibitor 2-like [Paramacrobiotus metropolitanus]|uniref:plasminogen activator inhibitor 2-like n=1 Tax=Paramacrobiotus metropolitanus TaxID=2943436 RepID=UPI0024457E1F|nr:plasminogen activator inhibitor 2-like [Paramacrobiotus metropolitanus]
MAYKYIYKKCPCTDNLLFSPFSTEIALLMAYTGSKAATKNEITNLLGFGSNYTFDDLASCLNQIKVQETEDGDDYCKDSDDEDDKFPENYKFHMANGCFIEDSFTVNACYRRDLETMFSAVCVSVPICNDPDEAVRQVNAFVASRTLGKVPTAVELDDLSSLTRLILVNALYFRSSWRQPFNEKHTAKRPFTTATGLVIMAETMRVLLKCNYGESEALHGAQFLELPYFNGFCSAFFILPGKKKKLFGKPSYRTLDELQNLLTPGKLLHAITGMCSVRAVTIQLPKFRIEENLDMRTMLEEMGMPSAFGKDANFLGISGMPLHINKMKQTAVIDVNEEGTEAGAASVAVMDLMGRDDSFREARFIADRPFIFIIRHNSTNTILFMGHINHPSAFS